MSEFEDQYGDDDADDLDDTADELVARSLLDQLLADSKLYRNSKSYLELLDFAGKIRNVAPFNAMLLQLQKPGLTFAASAYDWQQRFGRTIKTGARPLLILWAFGPVATVYDVLDTEGKPLPEDVACFVARGPIDAARITSFKERLPRAHIKWTWLDAGDASAGWIRPIQTLPHPKYPNDEKKQRTIYEMGINQNHDPAVQFNTLTHELAHLFLGHFGADRNRDIPLRPQLPHPQQELEAESVAYLVCARNDVKSKSQTYLSGYVSQHDTIDNLDLYQVMRAAGQVEKTLGLTTHTKFKKPPKLRTAQPKFTLRQTTPIPSGTISMEGLNEEDQLFLAEIAAALVTN